MNDLPVHVKEGIERAKQQSVDGLLIPHDEVMKEYEKYLWVWMLTGLMKPGRHLISSWASSKMGLCTSTNFIKDVNSTINTITTQPYIFKASIDKNFRQAYITKQTSMFYEVWDTQIMILYFWDNRQQPIL